MRTKHIATAILFAMAVVACGGPQTPEVKAPVTYDLQPLVRGGSPFHGIQGLRFDKDDTLHAASVIGQSIFKVDTATGKTELVVGPPQGMGDDLAFAPDGTMVWNAIEDGITYARSPEGEIRKLWENQRGVNSISFSRDGKRLFISLVFFGDALWELDLAGVKPPRLVVDKPGGFNAFQAADDGELYGPLNFGGRVVRINPDTGKIVTVSADFGRPGALKLDFKGHAYVLNNGSELKRIDLATGKTTLVTKLPFGTDNLAFDSKGRLFISLSEVNAIVEVNVDTGELHYVLEPTKLTSPTGMAVVTEAGQDTLYLGDLFGGVRLVNGTTGDVDNTPVDLFQPAHISVAGDHLLAVSEVFGEVQLIDRKNFTVLKRWDKFSWPADALEAPNGDLLVVESRAGRILRVTGPEAADRQVIVENLQEPKGLAWAGEDAVYVTEATGGRLLRVTLSNGSIAEVATDLAQPEGVAVEPSGSLLVMEVGAKRLTRLQPDGGERSVVAGDLPIGWSNGPSLYRSVAVSQSAIYFNSDVENTLYKLTPRQP